MKTDVSLIYLLIAESFSATENKVIFRRFLDIS